MFSMCFFASRRHDGQLDGLLLKISFRFHRFHPRNWPIEASELENTGAERSPSMLARFS